MKFTLHRDRTVVSTKGHIVEFKKGEPVHVPPEMHQEVLAVGAEPEEDLPEEEQPSGAQQPSDPAEREAALFAAFEAIILRGNRDEFTAGGAPHGRTLATELGYVVSSKERDLAWAKFRAKSDE